MDSTNPETMHSQICLQKPTEGGRVILATFSPSGFPFLVSKALPETRSCSPEPGKGRRHLGAAPSAWVRDGEGRGGC